jgi:alpha-L-arabinofuranosidase
VPYVTVYAGLSSQDGSLSIVIINKHEDKSYPVKVFVQNGQPAAMGTLYLLTGPSLVSQNEQDPMAVGIKEYMVRGLDKDFDYTAPPHSVSLIKVGMRKEDIG